MRPHKETQCYSCLVQGDYIWIEPASRREFDVAIGARVVTAEGRKIQVGCYFQFEMVGLVNLDVNRW